MPDQISVTTTQGFGSRIGSSIGGLFIGIILFVASFAVLYWNEGRYDVSRLAKTSTPIASTSVTQDASLQGKLVDTSGALTTDQQIGDGLYLKPGKYIAIRRTVEMYAWKESSSSQSSSNLGGSKTTQTTYTYSMAWQHEPADSANFKEPTGHQNPTPTIQDGATRALNASVGAYPISDFSQLELPSYSPVNLAANMLDLTASATLSGTQYIFIGSGTIDQPHLGDMRVSYAAINAGASVTVFGKLTGGFISSYTDDTGHTLFRAFDGNRDQAQAQLHGEFETWLWMFRVIGFLMMWIGMTMFFAPITTFLDIVPLFGSMGRGLVGVVTFLVALVLSFVTIVVSMILHNILAVIAALVIVAVIVIAWAKMKKPKTA